MARQLSVEAEKLLKKMICTECENLFLKDAFLCTNKHIHCSECASRLEYTCVFDNCLTTLTCASNPFKSFLSKNLPCKFDGCEWSFEDSKLEDHYKECNYAPVNCLGAMLELYKCNWKGTKINMMEHMMKVHDPIEYTFDFSGTFKIFDNKSKGTYKDLIRVDAFFKDFFLYYYYSFAMKQLVISPILVGTKKLASNFLLEFELHSTKQPDIKLKFMHPVMSDSIGTDGFNKKSIILTLPMIEQYFDSMKRLHYIGRILKRGRARAISKSSN